MRRKKSLLIPAVLAFSLCTGAVVPVLAEETSQTADAADNEQETHTQSATDTSDSPYEKGTITDTDFQSEWLNLKFTPPETVVMNTEEELQSVMKQGQTTLEESSGVELGDDALSYFVIIKTKDSKTDFYRLTTYYTRSFYMSFWNTLKQKLRSFIPVSRTYMDNKLRELEKENRRQEKILLELQKNSQSMLELKEYVSQELHRRDDWGKRAAQVQREAKERQIWVIKCPAPEEKKIRWAIMRMQLP